MKEQVKLQAAAIFSILSLMVISLSARLPTVSASEYEDHAGWVWLPIEFSGLYRASRTGVSFPSPILLIFLDGQDLKVWIASQPYLQTDTRKVVAYKHDHL